jgi:poly(A) polymerase
MVPPLTEFDADDEDSGASTDPIDDLPLGEDDDAPDSEPLPSDEAAVYSVELDEDHIDPDAAKVVRRLVRHGYEAYLVGGCVRDLLVKARPKDFDVVTNARPDDVRRLFRNSRIIGRRFRLVHVLFGAGKVIETATFRRPPEESARGDSEDLLIRNDNVFGDAPEDAQRRDFTINALFYDIERRQILDWVGGMPDIERRSVHTIGNPVVRFLEDPVRLLRAIKFSARLDFGISPDVYDAIVGCRHALRRAAKPRLFEEVLRLMRGGAAHRSIYIAWETGVLDVLLPELSTYLADREDDDDTVWRVLSEVDRRTRVEGAPLDDTVLCASLLLEPLREACLGERDRVEAAYEFLEPIVDRLNVPRRIAEPVRRIAAMLPRLESGRVGRFGRSGLYQLASEVAALRGVSLSGPAPDPEARASADPERRRKRRRRRPRVGEPGPA